MRTENLGRSPGLSLVRRAAAAVALAAITFTLGIKAGAARAPAPTPPAPTPPSGVELWETLPPELLANVAEGISERISDLQDDLRTVQTIQAEKMAGTG